MIFLHYIKFKHGKLKRGERCLFRGRPATYLGTYVDKDGTVDMIRIEELMSENGVPLMLQYIEQSRDRDDIVCVAQEEPAIEGQMRLC